METLWKTSVDFEPNHDDTFILLYLPPIKPLCY